LILADDLNLPLTKLRLRPKGSDGGHNGLRNISELLETNDFARLRVGIGSDFGKGKQVNYVLGEWTEQETSKLREVMKQAIEIIKSFGTIGIKRTMNLYN